jgi:hypothetical protein
MRQQARLMAGHAVLAATFTLGLPLLAAAAVEITHGGVDCVVAGQFPVIRAALEPPGELARARVYFHGRGAAVWYYVEMKGAGGSAFEGILPQPLSTLDGIEYYIETLAASFDERRSPEFDADVITSSDACPLGRTTAAMMSSVPSAIVVGAPGGAPAIPPGFANVGLAPAAGAAASTAAGASAGVSGGVSTGMLVGLGAAAAMAGIAVAAGDGGSSVAENPTAPTGGGGPQPTPTPTPVPMHDVTGRWAGTFDENPSPTRCTVETDLSLQLQQLGTAVSGAFQLVIGTANSVPADPCPVGPGDVLNGPVSGVVNGDTISLELGIPGGGPSLMLYGSVSDDRMGGTDPAGGGSWDVRRQ